MGRRVLGIDPGDVTSGWALLDVEKRIVLEAGVAENPRLKQELAYFDATDVAIEMIASYGMPVGREVFETCVWIGRFVERLESLAERPPVRLIYRRDVKVHLCGSMRAKDPNVRQALIDMLGPAGTKKEPGPTYGVTKDAWAALGVAVTAAGITPLTPAYGVAQS